MQTGNDHIIKKQSIVIEFHDRRGGMGLQNQVADIVKEKLIPRLDEVFSGIAGRGKYLSLDELLIDAGVLSSANWEEELVENTIRQIKEKLRTESPYNLQQEEVSDQAGAGRTDQVSNWEAFIHFLQYGYLPWFASNTTLSELEEKLLNNLKITNSTRSEKLATLQQKLVQDKNMLLRFILQFSAALTEEIIDAIAGTIKQKTKEGEKIIYSFSFLSANTKRQIILLFRLFYAGIGGEMKHLQSEAFKEAAEINATPSFYRLIKKELIPVHALIPARVLIELIEQALQYDSTKIVRTTDFLFESVMPVISPVKKNMRAKSQPAKDTGELEPESVKTSLPQKDNIPSKKSETDAEGIFISNAGLIILHPFLSGLFRALNMTNENNEWLQPSFHARAVLITQYLVTGTEETDEHLLVLNKLLCGYPSETPVERLLTLTDEEKRETESLLQTVIKYWEALKNTSIEGLRNTFLLRDGKLTINENGWLLQIEQKAWDVLLDTLPWGTSMIKTPWMNELLRVQWG